MEQGLYNEVRVDFIVLSSELSYDGRYYLIYFNKSLWRAKQSIKMSTLVDMDIHSYVIILDQYLTKK